MINSRYPTLVMQFTHTKAFHQNDEPKPERASVYPNPAGRETAKVFLRKLVRQTAGPTGGNVQIVFV
jgi:hypothetical protein